MKNDIKSTTHLDKLDYEIIYAILQDDPKKFRELLEQKYCI